MMKVNALIHTIYAIAIAQMNFSESVVSLSRRTGSGRTCLPSKKLDQFLTVPGARTSLHATRTDANKFLLAGNAEVAFFIENDDDRGGCEHPACYFCYDDHCGAGIRP
jgi:hypothetical protein